MSERTKEKQMALKGVVDKIIELRTDMEADESKMTADNEAQLESWLKEAEKLGKSIKQDQAIHGLQSFSDEPQAEVESAGAGDFYAPQTKGAVPTIGDTLVNSDQYKAAVKQGGGRFNFSVESKATFSLAGAGLTSGLAYLPGVTEVRQQRLTVRDLLAQGQTTLNSVPYIREASFTNSADMVAEEGEKPEGTIDIEDVTAPVKKIAVLLKVTDEMFADFPTLRSFVNERLRFMVMAKEEQQLLNGTGSGNQITGILQTANVETTSATTPGELNAIYKAIGKVRRIGHFEPDAVVINPEDWEEIRLLKDTTNGQYYGGGPFYAPYGNGPFIQEPLIWGLRPVITTAITKGTALVGAFRAGAQVFQREGLSLEVFNQHEDDVAYNRITIRAEERLALAVYSPKAFCTVTDISF